MSPLLPISLYLLSLLICCLTCLSLITACFIISPYLSSHLFLSSPLLSPSLLYSSFPFLWPCLSFPYLFLYLFSPLHYFPHLISISSQLFSPVLFSPLFSCSLSCLFSCIHRTSFSPSSPLFAFSSFPLFCFLSHSFSSLSPRSLLFSLLSSSCLISCPCLIFLLLLS